MVHHTIDDRASLALSPAASRAWRASHACANNIEKCAMPSMPETALVNSHELHPGLDNERVQMLACASPDHDHFVSA
eukprot:3874-Heterococcus_DN1.PRE.4